MDLLEIEEKREMSREQADRLLVHIADSLARQNNLQFEQGGNLSTKTRRVILPAIISIVRESRLVPPRGWVTGDFHLNAHGNG